LIISEKNDGFALFTPAAWLRVTGEDALVFLQGQVTQDLKTPPDGAAVYGLWLSQKGRVVADSTFFKVNEREVWVLSHGTASAVIRERMESYIIADDVVVDDFTEGASGLVAFGARAIAWMQQRFSSPFQPGKWLRREGGDDGSEVGFVFQGRRGIEPCWEWVSSGRLELPPVDAGETLPLQDVERARINAGIARIPYDLGPGELPNEGGLEDLAISYTKGCYLGQETMARLKSLGQVRRRLMRIRGSGVAPSVRPQPLFQKGKRVGELRTTVPLTEGGFAGFALFTLLSFDPTAPVSLAVDGAPSVSAN